MGFDMGSMLASPVGWTGGQATIPVQNLSPHVDGGESAVNVSNAATPTEDQQTILYGGVAVVGGAIALLWFFGGFALRGLPSL